MGVDTTAGRGWFRVGRGRLVTAAADGPFVSISMMPRRSRSCQDRVVSDYAACTRGVVSFLSDYERDVRAGDVHLRAARPAFTAE